MIQKKIFFVFYPTHCNLVKKNFLTNGIRFAIPPKGTDYSNILTEFELLYKSTLNLSMASEERDRFKTKSKGITLPSLKIFSGNCKLENNLSVEEINLLIVLMTNKNIIIQKDGKDDIVVITDREKYLENINSFSKT